MAQNKAEWMWLDWLVLSIRMLFIFLGFIFLYANFERLSLPVPFIVFWFIFAYSFPLLFFRPGYKNGALFSFSELAITGGLAIYLMIEIREVVGALNIAAFMIGYAGTKRSFWWSAPTLLLLFPVLEGIIIANPVASFSAAVNYAIMFAIGLCLNSLLVLLKKNEEQSKIIENQNQLLLEYSTQVEEMTILEERNRMAKDIHDTVGHTFTLTIMGMDTVSYLMDAAPHKAKEKLSQLRAVASKGLDEVRDHIHNLAPEEEKLPLHEQLQRLADDFSRHTSTEISFNWEGKETDLSGLNKIVLIRCFQEGVTNAIRHGQAAKIEADLHYDDELLVLRMKDHGKGMENVTYGFGLKTMKERLASVHGTLEVESTLGIGTIIQCTIPIGGNSKWKK